MAEQLVTFGRVTVPSSKDRARLQRRARLLAWGRNAWHLIESGIAMLMLIVPLFDGLHGFKKRALLLGWERS